MRRLVPVLMIATALFGLLWYSQQRSGPLLVSGFVEADEIRVGSRVGGRVSKVLVEEGQNVARDQPLVELEPFDLDEQIAQAVHEQEKADAVLRKLRSGFRAEEIAQAEARMQQANAELEKLRHGPREQEILAAEAELQLAEAEREFSQDVYQRVETLFGRQAADQTSLDEAMKKLSVATETVHVKQATLDLLREGTRPEDIQAAEARLAEASQYFQLQQSGYRPEEIAEAEAVRAAAAARLASLRRRREELVVRAPVDSVIEAIELRHGDLVTANAPAIALVDRQRMWVRAYVPENHLDIQLGQHVAVQVDSFPDRAFSGEIIFIARQAEFTPGNVQTPDERSKQVFRIKVLLKEGHDVLRPGMAADVVLAEGGGAP